MFDVAGTTACAFGGPDLRGLYTTASENPAGSGRAGALFVVPGAGLGLPSPACPDDRQTA